MNYSAMILIHTPLQRGDRRTRRAGNRFSGFGGRGQTVETVSSPPESKITPRKRGVNANGEAAAVSIAPDISKLTNNQLPITNS
jgi:hypothetical protein